MTEPQRHTLVMSGAAIVAGCLVLFLVFFGIRAIDIKSIVLLAGFFAVAAKIATVKHKRHRMI